MVLALALSLGGLDGRTWDHALRTAPAIAIGGVVIGGGFATTLDRGDIAQRAALLMQDSALELPLTAREVVALARLTDLRRFETERAADPAAMEIDGTQIEEARR